MAAIIISSDKDAILIRGTEWQFSGNINEDIVCTVIYFHDINNIEDLQIDLFAKGNPDNFHENENESEFLRKTFPTSLHILQDIIH